MDSFEINKIIGAILLTALIVIGIGKITDAIFYVEIPKQSAYKVEGLELAEVSNQSTEKSSKIEEKVDIAQLLALGDMRLVDPSNKLDSMFEATIKKYKKQRNAEQGMVNKTLDRNIIKQYKSELNDAIKNMNKEAHAYQLEKITYEITNEVNSLIPYLIKFLVRPISR